MTNTTADIVGEDPRIAHLERTKQDTERELSRVVDELAHVRAVGAQALEDATAALVAAESRISVEANRAAEMEAQAQREQDRADAAEQMVAEQQKALRAARRGLTPAYWPIGSPQEEALLAIDAALASTAEVAGRWVSVGQVIDALTKAGLALGVHSASDLDTHIKRVREDVDAIIAERDAAIANADRAAWNSQRMMEERDAAIAARDEAEASLDVYEQRIREIAYDVFGVIDGASVVLLDAIGRQCHRERIERITAERARDEVGIQFAAAQAEIARMRPVVEAATLACHAYFVSDPEDAYTGYMQHLEAELAKLRTVPGDALAPAAKPDAARAVDPDMWRHQPKYGVAGGPREHVLTRQGASRALQVGAQLNAPAADALEALGAGAQAIEKRSGAEMKLTDFGKKHGGALPDLTNRGLAEMHPGADGRAYSLTEKGKATLAAGQAEQARLLDRVKRAHPLPESNDGGDAGYGDALTKDGE